MCLYTTNNTVYEAQDDIKVFKVLQVTRNNVTVYITPYQGMMVPKDGILEPASNDISAEMQFGNTYSYGRGFIHSYRTRRDIDNIEFMCDDKYRIFRAIIPKGAKYIMNSRGEFASTRLQVLLNNPVAKN